MKIATRRGALAALVLAAAAAAPSRGQEAAPAAGPYESATACAQCHQAIHGYWSESEHARAVTRPAFLAGVEAAVAGATDKAAARKTCVWCHAPTALASGDYDLRQPITREGVTCDFCHTVADVDLTRRDQPFDLKPGRVKRGPLDYAKSPHHETSYSVLHKASPLLCAACHEYSNAHGVPVLSTYTEWSGGPYPARGQTCQECHMPQVPGTTVREELGPSQRHVNLHRMVGGSTASHVRTGLELRFQSVDIGAASADVHIMVTNTSVGHSAPGISTKSLVLAVGVDTGAGELAHRRERIYRRDMKDAEGRSLTTVPDLFLRAASVGEDTRLKQREARSERFTVPLPPTWKAIVARLEYHDASRSPTSTLVTEQRRERGR